jgi:hypothetical protein
MHTTERPKRAAGNDGASILSKARGSDTGPSNETIRPSYPELTEKGLEEACVNLTRYFEIAFAITAQLNGRDSDLTPSKPVSRMNERSNDQNKS